ncbi:[formate-C-acetyltransferase]-activating enzyme [Enterobacteriaceae bacterium 4M9]|nr:[formate-C-acetyltransferase]-activating enzyme [Enterobacteriaceae bacterium 4M9]
MTSSGAPHISCEVIDSRATTARIFNIQRYSLNDGQGIRTVVFFKGCPHTCPWCANPESVSPKIETVRRESKCLHCDTCRMDVTECPSGAWEHIGRDVALTDLVQEVLKDDVFFRVSGGGVTLSGGEVLMQAEFAARFLRNLRQYGVTTAIETAGDASWTRLMPLARECDEVLFDLKIMDTQRAQHILRINQPRVLDNFRRLVAHKIAVTPRVPLIPGYTMDRENFTAILTFLSSLPVRHIHLLPYHEYGAPKYALTKRSWKMGNVRSLEASDIEPFRALASDAGFQVTIGG